MNAETLERELAAIDPAPPYSPADAGRAERALTALLDGDREPSPSEETPRPRWAPLAAAATVAALAVGVGALAARDRGAPPAGPASSASASDPVGLTGADRTWLRENCAIGISGVHLIDGPDREPELLGAQRQGSWVWAVASDRVGILGRCVLPVSDLGRQATRFDIRLVDIEPPAAAELALAIDGLVRTGVRSQREPGFSAAPAPGRLLELSGFVGPQVKDATLELASGRQIELAITTAASRPAGRFFDTLVVDPSDADVFGPATYHLTLADGTTREQHADTLALRSSPAAQPYDPAFVPALADGSTARKAREVCAAKFAESPEQAALAGDAPLVAVEKRDGLFMVLVGDEAGVGWCLFDKATLADPAEPAAWGLVQLTPGASAAAQIGARDIGDISRRGYGADGPSPGPDDPTWSVAAIDGYAGSEVRGIAALTPHGRLPALMAGRWFTVWWPARPGTPAGPLAYELLLADGTVTTVRR
ncbi:hypothetical protein BN11_1380002 [Nostocoides australiense Ben110]|uniref:Uncharacterized protein n=1 Tax=Nostocoides australiense Ben110 TaxID=1193182 RepID=W6JUD0_9MICO|nr:hypothetical protein [Tetrasphaera australiensis]CCH72141.1 hypothetical protein BN11_1380002 [Tetrasphaera australiensis Ben110]